MSMNSNNDKTNNNNNIHQGFSNNFNTTENNVNSSSQSYSGFSIPKAEKGNFGGDDIDTQSIPVVPTGEHPQMIQQSNGFMSHQQPPVNAQNYHGANSANTNNPYSQQTSYNSYPYVPENEIKKKKGGWIVPLGLAAAIVVGGLSGYVTSEYNNENGDSAYTHSSQTVKKSSATVDESSSMWGDTIQSVSDSVVGLTVYKKDGNGGYGSGVIISNDGYILTNHHVSENMKKINVSLNDGSVYEAKVVGSDPSTDLAVLALKNAPKNLSPASFADSNDVKSGDSVLAIGNPLGLDQTSTTGIVSAVKRPVTSNEKDNGQAATYTNAIQIDAAINPGNSGGPLFNSNGDVIGVTSSIATVPNGLGSSSGGSIGIGFAIPANQASKVSDQIIKAGEVSHGLFGAKVTNALTKVDKVQKQGAGIVEVTKGGPADKAGIKKGDVVIKVNGDTIKGSESITATIREYTDKDKVEITYVRSGKTHKASVELDSLQNIK